MRVLNITRRQGPYGAVRKLDVYVDGEKRGSMKQNETLVIEVADNAREIYGKMDWGRTESFPIGDLPDGTDMVIWAWFTLNPMRTFGIKTIPMKFDLPV